MVLPDEGQAGKIRQRDTLNLRALAAVATRLSLPVVLVAAAPGVDAAAVAPSYARRLSAPGAGAVRVIEMGNDGVLQPSSAAAQACPLPLLPEALFGQRLSPGVEGAFHAHLRPLASRILSDATRVGVEAEHASKTYVMAAACAEEVLGNGALAGEFFVLGRFRYAEKARAQMHSSFAAGLYDVSRWARPVGPSIAR